jgi:serine/threonine protein kinase
MGDNRYSSPPEPPHGSRGDQSYPRGVRAVPGEQSYPGVRAQGAYPSSHVALPAMQHGSHAPSPFPAMPIASGGPNGGYTGQSVSRAPAGYAPPPQDAAANRQWTSAQPPPQVGLKPDGSRDIRPAPFHVTRSRAYSFVLDGKGQPIELGSGRFAKAYLGEERWLQSKTDFRREIVIKILQKGVSDDDHMRFQMEKELLERVQGHSNIVQLFASGEGENIQFLPLPIRDLVEPEFVILERLQMSLEERLKGSRNRGQKDDLLRCNVRERLFRVLDYMIPIASAVEYAHLVKNVCHRDIKPANILIKLPDPNLRGSTLEVRLADFNVAKVEDNDVQLGMTHLKGSVPGTLFFQSPEQETNIIELLVNVQQGSPEVEFFEDFYIQIAKNDSFSLFNRGESYTILSADRARKRIVLSRPYRDPPEANVRARIQKSVGRPADIYSLGAMLYYLISGAYANPKTLYDAFHKFIEYEKSDENNTIEGYLRHEYGVIQSLRAPKTDGQAVAPADRFFSYKHYLDGNGELIDPNVMLIVGKCMIRNKPDSYCRPHDLDTRGISELVQDLINLYALYGVHPAARPTHLTMTRPATISRMGKGFRSFWWRFLSLFRRNNRKR